MSKNRYITLLGDPIHTHPVKAVAMSSDFTAAGMGVAATALLHSNVEDLTGLLSSVFLSNVSDIAFTKLLAEKIVLSPIHKNKDCLMIPSNDLKNLCIDTTPTPEAALKSIEKHSDGIKYTKFVYGALFTLDVGSSAGITLSRFWGSLSTGQPITPDNTHYLVAHASFITRMYKGFQRFNKLSKGEWAIVTTPSKEPVKEKTKHKDFSIA